MGLDTETPNYLLTEERKYEELGAEAIRRAVRFEERARTEKVKLVLECVKEPERKKRGPRAARP